MSKEETNSTDQIVDTKVTTMTDLSGKKSKILLLKNETEIEAFKEQLRLCSVLVPKSTLCETCQDKGQYYAGTLIGYVNCPDCN